MQQTHTGNNLGVEPLSQLLDELLGQDILSRLAKVMTLIAKGRPVPVGDVAESLGISQEDAKAWLAKFGAELDEEGNLLGLGLTSVPTPHTFEVDGHNFYAWCAGDTLIFPAILGKSARVESTDPISGAKIRLIAMPQGVQEIEPGTAVLTWPKFADSSDIRGTVCYPSLWFASRETAQEYASKNGGVTIRTPEEFRETLKAIPEKLRTNPGPREYAKATPKQSTARLGCR